MIDTTIKVLNTIRNNDWKEMLEVVPEGVEYRGDLYYTEEHFVSWDTYEDYSRYVAPAREMIIQLYIDRSIEKLKLQR